MFGSPERKVESENTSDANHPETPEEVFSLDLPRRDYTYLFEPNHILKRRDWPWPAPCYREERHCGVCDAHRCHGSVVLT